MNDLAHPHDPAALTATLRDRLLRLAPRAGRVETSVPGLAVTRIDQPAKADNCFYAPAVGIVAQGFKRSVIGSEVYQYGQGSCLVNGVDMPSLNTIADASADHPFLAVSLLLDRALATEVLAEVPAFSEQGGSGRGVSVAEADPDILGAFIRLAELTDRPEELPALSPLIIREIHYRILLGPQGGCLRRICAPGTRTGQIAAAITWLRQNFAKPVHIDELAATVNMATSTFHRHFKHITSLSPLQFQKRLRLYEAQRLMLSGDRDATSACLAVGYESPTQFNREYKRLFGQPPHRDINRLRGH